MATLIFFRFLVLVALWVVIYLASRKNSSYFEELTSDAKKVPFSEGELRTLRGSIYYSLLFLGFVLSFAIIGWSSLLYASLLLLAIAGAILAYAARDIVADFLSGVIIAARGEIKAGDILELSTMESGKVEKVSLLATRFATEDGRLITISNSLLTQDLYAVQPSGADRRVTIKVDIKEPGQAANAMELIKRTGEEYEKRDKEKTVEVDLAEAAEIGATLTLGLDVKAKDYGPAKNELQLALISALNSQNIKFASIAAE